MADFPPAQPFADKPGSSWHSWSMPGVWGQQFALFACSLQAKRQVAQTNPPSQASGGNLSGSRLPWQSKHFWGARNKHVPICVDCMCCCLVPWCQVPQARVGGLNFTGQEEGPTLNDRNNHTDTLHHPGLAWPNTFECVIKAASQELPIPGKPVVGGTGTCPPTSPALQPLLAAGSFFLFHVLLFGMSCFGV